MTSTTPFPNPPAPRSSHSATWTLCALTGGLLYASASLAAGLVCTPWHATAVRHLVDSAAGQQATAAQPGLPVVSGATSGAAVLGVMPIAAGR